MLVLVLCCIYLAGDQWTVLRGLDHSNWRVLDLVDQSNWRHVIQQNTTRLWEHLTRGSVMLCDIYEVVQTEVTVLEILTSE